MSQLELPGVCAAIGLRQALSWMFESLDCSIWTARMHGDHARYLIGYFRDVPIAQIGYVQLRNYIQDERRRGLAKETIRKRLGTLAMALREGVAHGVIERLPEWPVIRSDTRSKQGFWTRAQWEAAHLANDDDEFRTWVAVGWFTGMHTSDNNRFRWGDIDLVKGHWVRRNSKTRVPPAVLPLPARLAEIVRERYELLRPHPRDLVSGHSMGHPNRAIKQLAQRADIPVISPIEAARHSCETYLDENGASEQYRVTWLGLTSARMLKRHYRHLSPDALAANFSAVEHAGNRP